MKVILHNIRSAYNVGAIFRTADGAGVQKIFLTGYTPTPTDRFGRVQAEIKKTSLGASETVDWEQGDYKEVVAALKESGSHIAAIEQTPESVSLSEFKPTEKTVYVFGNEVTGIEQEDLHLADYVVDIPMLGTKKSLNVSVAAGIVMYHGTV